MECLTRKAFKEKCFKRDNGKCVLCGKNAVDAHHIMDRKLFADGGYYLDNGASVCDSCHVRCEQSLVTVEDVRKAAGITTVVLPPYLDKEVVYNKWGKAMFDLDNRIKYPKSMHLPWSPGLQNDDRRIESLDGFEGKEVVVTVKMDGENTTMYSNAIHARSIDVAFTHPSRAWVRALHGSIKHDTPAGWRLCGENLYAEHSIVYRNLPSYFMLFSIWTDRNECLSWDETVEWAGLLGVTLVPQVWRGPWGDFDKDKIFDLAKKVGTLYSDDVEGYVVRTVDGFHYDDFHRYLAKYVRKGHIQTDEHWMEKVVVPNKLGGA